MIKTLSGISVLLLLSLFTSTGHLYSQRVSYAYDTAGNRISRTITLSTVQQKSSPLEKDGQEVFTESAGEHEISIYPNPTRGMLSVRITGGGSDETIALFLYDLQGVFLQKQEFKAGAAGSVDLSAYPASTYLLRLRMGKKEIDYKIIKL